MNQELPSLFISHGAPTILLNHSLASRFLRQAAEDLPRPKAILVISAHWLTSLPTVNTTPRPKLIYDFSGFPKALYEIDYAPPGSSALAERIMSLLNNAGFTPQADNERGLDHGAWTPLALMYPQADIPTLQLSLQQNKDAEYHYKLGEALQPLRRENVLVIGSGAMTHNLSELLMHDINATPATWALEFQSWMADAIDNGRTEALIHYRTQAPFAKKCHPTEEHLLPLYVAMGCGGYAAHGKRIHSSIEYGALAMDAYSFSHNSRNPNGSASASN